MNLFTPEIRTDTAARRRVLDWIDALRSGKYAQGYRTLRTFDDRFCCLGVTCDLQAEALGGWNHGYEIDSNFSLLAQSRARELYRLRTEDGEFGNHTLTGLNDDGSTFAEIADVIEAEFLAALA